MDYQVKSIPKEQTHQWLLYKHYARRVPPIIYAYGLFDGKDMVGVCTFGTPTRLMNDGDCIFEDYKIKTVELNRLVINEDMPKNTLSNFVSKCLKLLPKPMCVVSYSDYSVGHNGYIYQATNWIYTGLNQVHERKIVMNGKELHPRTAWEIAKKRGFNDTKSWVDNTENVEQLEYTKKHRYFQFLGSKRDKKEMIKAFKYEILPYPKGDNQRYDASYEPSVQRALI